jgi:heme A synthase
MKYKDISAKSYAFMLMGLLALQYILGMITNLYVEFPAGKSNSQEWHFASSQFVVMSHIILGMLLLVASVALWVKAYKSDDKNWKIASGITFGSVVLAAVSGSEFVSLQQEIYSFAMSAFFVLAVGALAWGLYAGKK